MSGRRFLAVSVLVLFFSACGPGIEEGPSLKESVNETRQDGGEKTETDSTRPTDSESESMMTPSTDSGTSSSDTAPSIPTDTTPPEFCIPPLFEDTPLVTVDSHFQGGRYMAIGNKCILAAIPDGENTRVQISFLDDKRPDVIFATELEGTFVGTPVDLTCDLDDISLEWTAMIAINDNGVGTVFKRTSKDDTWRRLFEGPEITGIKRLSKTNPRYNNRVCAFGSGIYCTEGDADAGDWQQEFATAPSRITDLNLVMCDSGWCEAAVGENGLLAIRQNSVWELIETNTDETLLSVNAKDTRYAAVCADGTLLIGTANSPPHAHRPLENKTIVSFFWYYDSNFVFASRDGGIFQGKLLSDTLILCPDYSKPSDNIIDGALSTCEESTNYLVFDEQTIYGLYGCNDIVTI